MTTEMPITIGDYVIRDWRPTDAASRAKHANNPRVAMHLRDRFPYPYGFADAEAFLAMVERQSPRTFFAIATEEEAIGSIGLSLGEDIHRLTAELGYFLAEPYWNKDITTLAVKSVTRYGFDVLKLNRIFAEPFANNAASARVLEKAGYTCEGRMRASAVKGGEVLDQLLYAKVRDDL
jgi:RimJ/RimL family protein N-acetyltransferase